MASTKCDPNKGTAYGRRAVRAAFFGATAFVAVCACVWCHIQQQRDLVHRIADETRRLGGQCVVRGKFHLNIVSVDVGGLSDFTDSRLALLADQNPRVLDLGSTAITNDGLKHLSSMRTLVLLNLEGTQITDEGLKHLRGVIGDSHLRHLDLSRTGVTDGGLKKHISRLGNLTSLNLEGAHVTDDSVRHLAGMVRHSRLRHLNLSRTKVTDEGVQCLGDPKLCCIWLDCTEVGDKGVRKLLKKRNVNSLSLAGSRVTDDACKWLGLVHCLNLADTGVTDRGVEELLNRDGQHIVCLDLSNTQVTDGVWDDLERLSRLIMVSVRGTGVTGQGVAAFRHAKPTCVVFAHEPVQSSRSLLTPATQMCDRLMKGQLIGRNAQNLRHLLDAADSREDWPSDATSFYEFYLAKGDYEGEPIITLEVDIPTETVYGAFVAAPIW